MPKHGISFSGVAPDILEEQEGKEVFPPFFSFIRKIVGAPMVHGFLLQLEKSLSYWYLSCHVHTCGCLEEINQAWEAQHNSIKLVQWEWNEMENTTEMYPFFELNNSF